MRLGSARSHGAAFSVDVEAALPAIGYSARPVQGAHEERVLAGGNDFICTLLTMAGLVRVLRRHPRWLLRTEPADAAGVPLLAVQGR